MRSGSSSPPAALAFAYTHFPGFRSEPASGKAKTCPVLEGCVCGSRLRNQESRTGVATRLNGRFHHQAEARCWRAGEGGEELFFEGGKSPQTPAHFAEAQTTVSLQALGRWVPRIAELVKQGEPAPKAKAPTPAAPFRVPPQLGVFLSFLQQPAGFQLTQQARRAQSAGKPRAGSLQGGASRLWPRSAGGKPQCSPLPRLLPNDKGVRALSGFSLLSFTLGCKSLSFSSPHPPPEK